MTNAGSCDGDIKDGSFMVFTENVQDDISSKQTVCHELETPMSNLIRLRLHLRNSINPDDTHLFCIHPFRILSER